MRLAARAVAEGGELILLVDRPHDDHVGAARAAHPGGERVGLVRIDGRIAADERSPLGFDIQMETITKVGGPAERLPLEISNDRKIKNLQLDTMLNNRVVALRNPRIRAIMKVADVYFAHKAKNEKISEAQIKAIWQQAFQQGQQHAKAQKKQED